MYTSEYQNTQINSGLENVTASGLKSDSALTVPAWVKSNSSMPLRTPYRRLTFGGGNYHFTSRVTIISPSEKECAAVLSFTL